MAKPPATMLALVAVAAVAAGGAAAVTGGVQDEDSAQPRQGACDRFASPRGHRSVQRLVNSLRPGEVGCLRKGTYRGALSIRRGGTPGHPITLQPRPGESARILGPIVVTGRASHVVVRRLYLNGRNRSESPSPIVNGQRILFADNDVTNDHTAICFALGNYRFGVARHVTLQRNRVHDCGTLPATNLEQGVYVAIARDTRVIGNWIYANADQGVQLYPDARRTRVVGNVIDSNGEGIIFGGSGRLAASDNLVEGNVISNSTLRDNVEASFDGPLGSGNLLRRNCIGGGARDDGLGGIISPVFGFSAIDNLVAAPAFKGAGSSDYRLVAGSPCVRVFRGDPNRVPGPGLPPPGG